MARVVHEHVRPPPRRAVPSLVTRAALLPTGHCELCQMVGAVSSGQWRVARAVLARRAALRVHVRRTSRAIAVPVSLNVQLPTRLCELPTRHSEQCWCMVLLELRWHEVLWQPGQRKSVSARTLKAGSAKRSRL